MQFDVDRQKSTMASLTSAFNNQAIVNCNAVCEHSVSSVAMQIVTDGLRPSGNYISSVLLVRTVIIQHISSQKLGAYV